MACVGLFSRLGIYHIPSSSCRRHGGALASSISMQQALVFFWCRSGLLVDRRDAYWWVLSGWFLGRRVNLGGIEHLQYPASSWLVIPLWVFPPVCPCSAAPVVSISYRQCWPSKNLWRLALFADHPRNRRAEVRRRFHRWKLGAGVMRGKIEDSALLNWHWSVNSANNKRFGHSQLKAHFFYSGFSAEILTKHLRLHLLCSSCSRFKNSIKRAPEPSGLVWSSDSLNPWSNKGCCGLWRRAPCAYNFLNCDAMSWRLWQ